MCELLLLNIKKLVHYNVLTECKLEGQNFYDGKLELF